MINYGSKLISPVREHLLLFHLFLILNRNRHVKKLCHLRGAFCGCVDHAMMDDTDVEPPDEETVMRMGLPLLQPLSNVKKSNAIAVEQRFSSRAASLTQSLMQPLATCATKTKQLKVCGLRKNLECSSSHSKYGMLTMNQLENRAF